MGQREQNLQAFLSPGQTFQQGQTFTDHQVTYGKQPLNTEQVPCHMKSVPGQVTEENQTFIERHTDEHMKEEYVDGRHVQVTGRQYTGEQLRISENEVSGEERIRTEIQLLEVEIERLRQELHRRVNDQYDHLHHPDVLSLSQKLDELIVFYHQLSSL